MMIVLKNCPFCGSEKREDGYGVECKNRQCVTNRLDISSTEAWNTRPIEDALQARIDELEKELSDARFCMALHGWGGSLTAEPKENE